MNIVRDILAVKVVDGKELNQCVNHFDYEPRVAFNELNSDSLNICVVYWHFPPDWGEYQAHCTYVNRELIRRFREEGIDFAYPTQTLHIAGESDRL